jgi:hypothetical protein
MSPFPLAQLFGYASVDLVFWYRHDLLEDALESLHRRAASE